MAAQDPLHFSLSDIHDNPEGWGPGDVSEQVKDTEIAFHFRLPEIHDNPDGWGPSDVPEQFKDTPYQPFSKGDRLGKVADWSGSMYNDKRQANKYNVGYGAGASAYAYFHNQEEEMNFQLVDFSKPQRMHRTKMKLAYRQQRRGFDDRRKAPQQPQVKHKERRSKNARYHKSIRFYQPNQVQTKARDPSVEVKNDWKVVEGGEIDFAQMAKLNLPLEKRPETLCTLGSLGLYQKQFDRTSVKNPTPLRRVNRRHYRVTTTDDPIIKKLAKENPDCNVFATDTILTTLMTCARSVFSWDVIVQRLGKSHIFFDMRDGSKLDLPTVNETASPPPQDEKGINSQNSLMTEATYINQNFSQQVLSPTPPKSDKLILDGANPFDDEEDDRSTELASVAYRYRKWDLGGNIKVVARCKLDAYMQTTMGEALVNIKACNEWDSKAASTAEWRTKLDKQRGAILATEIKNNGFKMARWTMEAILAGAEFIKFGYVSRCAPKDSTQHVILGVQQFQPLELAKQMTLNVGNAWGVLKVIIECCLKLEPGKYIILKDPNKPVVRIYALPDEDEEEEEEEFTLRVHGGRVVHSYGRLIPHELPITDLQQISGPDGIGRITCTVSSGTDGFVVNSGNMLGTGGVYQTRNGATATLVVNPSNADSFKNRALYCTDVNTNFFYLFISSDSPLSVPSLTVNSVTNAAVEYQVRRNDDITVPLITGYEVIRFGVPMIGQYVNSGRGGTVTISPAVPAAQYRITAWALGDSGRRSATPAVVDATTGEAGPTPPKEVIMTRVFQDGIELNWLPPTEPNGVVHYVIYYTPENGTEQSIDTGSDLTHYNLTGLERNRVYNNIAVQAVNSAGMSERSAVIAQYNHTPPATNTDPTVLTSESNQAGLIAGVVVVILVVVLLSLVVGVVAVVVVVRRRNRRRKEEQNTKAAESYKVYMNLEGKGSPDGTETIRTKNEEDHKPVDPDHSEQYSYAITKPAPDPKGYSADMYTAAHYSEVDQIPSETEQAKVTQQPASGGKWGEYEDLSVEVKEGGSNECVYAEPDAPTDGKLQGSSNKPKEEVVPVNAEQFYAQPDMAKKKNKRTQQQQEREGVTEDSKSGLTPKEEIVVPVNAEQFYAQPDMAKKRNKKTKQQQEQEEVSEDSRAAPPPPVPYKKSLQEAVDVVP